MDARHSAVEDLLTINNYWTIEEIAGFHGPVVAFFNKGFSRLLFESKIKIT